MTTREWRGQRLAAIAMGLAGLCAGVLEAADDAVLQALTDALGQAPLAPAVPQRAMLLSVTQAGTRLVAVGEHGVITLSDDQGLHWRNARSGTDVTLTQVRFADAQTGWAVGHLGLVLRTDDGGQTWQRQLDGQRLAALLLDQARTSGDAKALETAQRLAAEGADKPWLDLLVEGRDQIVLVGAFNLALRSGDGGRTWQDFAAQLPNPSGFHLYGVSRVGSELLLVGEQGLMLMGTPGQGFRKLPSVYEGTFFGAVALTPRRLVVHGLRGTVFHSEDGGASWQPSKVAGATASFNTAVVLAGQRLVLGDQAGRLFLSADGGATFSALPSGGPPITGAVSLPDGGLMLSTLAGVLPVAPKQLAATQNRPS
jgi:photosystem II stability/assembly factor-like uncharacterized protein